MHTHLPLRDYEETYFREHPEEISDYLSILFEEYATSNDLRTLLTSLRMLSRISGISQLAHTTGLSRKGVQKALSEDGNPKFENINAILKAMGYCLIPQKLPI